MPNPKNYDNKDDWMGVCMHQLKKNEGKGQGESVAQCLSTWRNKDKKKKKCASEILRHLSASLKSDIKNSDKTKNIIIFLGGECSKDNAWRKDIKKEFKDNVFFLDPYDESWKADENIYNEIEGLLKSDHVVFYKGGDGTKKEIKFLDSIGSKSYKKFNDLEDLKKYIYSVSKPISQRKTKDYDSLRGITSSITKESYPWADLGDLKFERIEADSLRKLIDDINSGYDIYYDPSVKDLKDTNQTPVGKIRNSDIMEQSKSNFILGAVLRGIKKFNPHSTDMYYDSKNKTVKPMKSIAIEPTGNPPATIKEAKLGVEYGFCSTQVDLPENLANKVMSWGMGIPEVELYVEDDGGCGRENEIHVTLLYGLTEDKPEKVKKMLYGVRPFEVTLGSITAFLDSDKHDVLKIDVDSPVLQRLHYILEDNLPNKNSYPTYHPHITIAYLKKGEAEKYIGMDDFRGITFIADEIVFSSRNGDKIPLSLTGGNRKKASSDVIYTGLFFDPSDPGFREEKAGPFLDKKIRDPHVTFAFKPTPDKEFPPDLIGDEVDIKVIGVGNDGKNHGYMVEIPYDLRDYYKGAPIPHITLSTSKDGKPVDTKNLDFKDITPFNIKGKVGHFTKSGIKGI